DSISTLESPTWGTRILRARKGFFKGYAFPLGSVNDAIQEEFIHINFVNDSSACDLHEKEPL
ncbi:hypothetical protein SK128_001212, partial [Halocaridina rubra]